MTGWDNALERLRTGNFGAAVFDMDGTIMDSMGFWNHIDEVFLARRGIETVPEDYLLAIAHLGAEETALYTKERFGLDETPEEMMREWFGDAVHYYTYDAQLKPGAYEYLKKLHGAGVKMALATASSEELYVPALKRCGVYELFSAFATVSECERKKGFPDIYLLACERMGAEPTECVVFEDIFVAVKGAKDGGFFTVGVSDPSSKRDSELIRQTADLYIDGFGIFI